MRSISIQKIADLKKSGGKVKVMPKAVKTPVVSPRVDPMEKALNELSTQAKALASREDPMPMVMRSMEKISQSVSAAVDKLKDLHGNAPIKKWDIQIQRGSDRLIKSLKLKAEV